MGLGTLERVTLYFTESATPDEHDPALRGLDAAHADILGRTARIRSGDFAPHSIARCVQSVRIRTAVPDVGRQLLSDSYSR